MGGKKLKVLEKPEHLSISFFFFFPSMSFFLTLFTIDLPSLMSICCTQGPWESVQFLFWHLFLITHVYDWSPELGRGCRDGSPCYMMALRLSQSPGQLLLLGMVETDTCNGPRAWRLSSEQPPFGPKPLPINGPCGASHTGAVRYLCLFVWSNPAQLKPGLAACTFKLILWHLRGPDHWKQTSATFVKCDLANWFWSGWSTVPRRESTGVGLWQKEKLLLSCRCAGDEMELLLH